jgi:hypothetical protein
MDDPQQSEGSGIDEGAKWRKRAKHKPSDDISQRGTPAFNWARCDYALSLIGRQLNA